MSLEIFQIKFYSEYERINDDLKSLEQGDESMSKYELIAKRIQLLQNLFGDNHAGLPTYEQRKAQNYLEKLNAYASQRRNEIFPKKKFAFKSKNKLISGKEMDEQIQQQQQQQQVAPSTQIESQSYNHTCTIKDLNGETIVKREDEVNGQDIGIFNLKDCVVKLLGKPSVLHLSNIKNTLILCGPIVGSAFINNCKNCKLNLACHQLRIHESLETDFYVNVVSRAIIENCHNVRFGPYSWSYKDINQHFIDTNIKAICSENNNSWRKIDDFNWLVTNQKSPNWDFLNDNDILKWCDDEL